MSKRTHRRDRLIALAIAASLLPCVVHAGTATYIGSSGDWSTGAWSPNAPAAGDSVVLPNAGVTVNFDAAANPGTLGNLTVDTTGSGTVAFSQSSNELYLATEFVGYTGRGVLNLSGGTQRPSGLGVGEFAGSSGTVNLSGNGWLAVAGGEMVGTYGGGVFLQTGGRNQCIGLSVGYSNTGSVAASGVYILSDGILAIGGGYPGYENIGYAANGSFTQNGGTNSTGYLMVGYLAGGNGTYTLGGGRLSAPLSYVGDYGTGLFNQSGGSNFASSLILGQAPASVTQSAGVGIYNLSAGALTISGSGIVGGQGTGTFNQTGGTAQVPTLYIAQSPGSSGTVTLSGGLLSATNVTVGGGTSSGGTATLSVSTAGNLAISNTLLIYSHSSQIEQSGGTISAAIVNIYGGGTYALSGSGNLAATTLNIGSNSIAMGTFTEQGGSATISGTTSIAAGSLASISAGSFVTPDLLNNGTFTQVGGTATITTLTGTGVASVGGTAGRATLTTVSLMQESFTIGINGSVILSTNATPSFSTLGALAMTGGTLDLGNNGLAMNYSRTNTPLVQVASWISSARGTNATWAGTGLTSAYAAANPANIGIGYNEAAAVAAFHTNFLGLAISTSSTAVLVQPTLYGDITLTGTVNLDDLNIFAANFGKPTTHGWAAGDFLNEGSVTLDDLNLFAANFGKSLGGFPALTLTQYTAGESILASLGTASIPEPAAGLLLVAAALALRRNRPRRMRRDSKPSSQH